MYLIERFASDSGKKGGEFYTPHKVSELLAKLLNPQPGDRICDPAIGSGSLAITVAEEGVVKILKFMARKVMERPGLCAK